MRTATAFTAPLACTLTVLAAACATGGGGTADPAAATEPVRSAGEATAKLERTKNWEVGDKLTFDWVLSGKSKRLVEEVVAVDESAVRIKSTAGDRTYDAALSAGDMSYPKGICLSNGQACEFSPAFVWVDFPLERGKKWSGTTTVTGETFISEVAYEVTVDKVEKIKTPAGQFDAFKLLTRGRIKATDKSGGSPSTGQESSAAWLASVNGKLVPVKIEYKNSYGEPFTRELAMVEIR